MLSLFDILHSVLHQSISDHTEAREHAVDAALARRGRAVGEVRGRAEVARQQSTHARDVQAKRAGVLPAGGGTYLLAFLARKDRIRHTLARHRNAQLNTPHHNCQRKRKQRVTCD